MGGLEPPIHFEERKGTTEVVPLPNCSDPGFPGAFFGSFLASAESKG